MTNNPQADLYRIVSYEAMCNELEGLSTITNLFYILNIVKSEELFRKAFEIGNLPIEQSDDMQVYELEQSLEREIAKGNYHKTIYHQIMMIDNLSNNPFNKLQQAMELLHNNNKRQLPTDLQYFLNNQFDLWNNKYQSTRAVIESFINEGLKLSDKEIIETINNLNKEIKDENNRKINN